MISTLFFIAAAGVVVLYTTCKLFDINISEKFGIPSSILTTVAILAVILLMFGGFAMKDVENTFAALNDTTKQIVEWK